MTDVLTYMYILTHRHRPLRVSEYFHTLADH